MKTILPLVLASLLASLPALADEGSAGGASAPLITTLFSDGSTNTWSKADLVAALQLMNRKYHREVETPSGRAAWHGRLVSQAIDTNALVKIERYADGTEFTIPFAPPAHPRPTPPAFDANGVPSRLAAARARRAAERAATNTVTVVVTPDAPTATDPSMPTPEE